jgi:transglutaminase/protease-like cytokinesis protein 3
MIGSTTMLTAAITPSDANNQNYSWSSSNSSIATVSSSGVVTGISEGTAVITVTSADGGFTAPCNITVIPIAVTGVGITPSTVTTRIGANTTLMATVAPSNATNKTVSWSSSDTGVATVSSAGVVTGVAAGTAVITVTTEDGGYTANSIITVSGTCNATGYITFEKWLNIYGITVASLTGNAKYPNNPSSSTTLTSFEIPTNSANYYGSRISGYICPPATGNYTFWIAADDAAQLWLSTNNLEANKVLIAYTDKYTSSRQWNKYSTQKSAVIYLVQGNTYYIEALHKEGTVNDNMAVGWLKPGQTGTSPSQVIPGSVLSPRTPLKIATIESRSALIPVLDVYPNPARNEILFNLPENLLGEKVVVSIMSMNGQVILNKELTFSGPEQTDIRSCVPGLYILRVQNKDFSINKSFVVYR